MSRKGTFTDAEMRGYLGGRGGGVEITVNGHKGALGVYRNVPKGGRGESCTILYASTRNY